MLTVILRRRSPGRYSPGFFMSIRAGLAAGATLVGIRPGLLRKTGRVLLGRLRLPREALPHTPQGLCFGKKTREEVQTPSTPTLAWGKNSLIMRCAMLFSFLYSSAQRSLTPHSTLHTYLIPSASLGSLSHSSKLTARNFSTSARYFSLNRVTRPISFT